MFLSGKKLSKKMSRMLSQISSAQSELLVHRTIQHDSGMMWHIDSIPCCMYLNSTGCGPDQKL